MALKFWDRIGRNYRKDGWAEIIEGMEEAVFECAKQGEKWVEAIKAGWDLLSPGTSHRGRQPSRLQLTLAIV